jgi:hypothetical protein
MWQADAELEEAIGGLMGLEVRGSGEGDARRATVENNLFSPPDAAPSVDAPVRQ